jgi:glutathione S-transferase
MKLYVSGRTPNPRRVSVFLAEKGLHIERVDLDIMKEEHKDAGFVAMNPWQRVPVLVLDDGTAICESIAICRYVEALHPMPPLFGTTPTSQALIEMWNRRLELNLLAQIAAIFRHSHPAMAHLEVPQVPAWAQANRPKVDESLAILDRELANREFIAGDTYSVADITGLIALDFMKPVKLTIPDGLDHIRRWHETLRARPSGSVW